MTRTMAVLPLVVLAATGLLLAAQPPPANPAANNPHLGNPQSIRSGMALYRIGCADCHGLDAGGYRGPDLIALLASGVTDERLFQTIRKGVPGTEMPAARENDTPDDDLLMIIAYLRKIGTVAPTETPVGNVEHGAALFKAQCVSCHRVAGAGAALTREIRSPSDWIPPAFEMVTVVTKDGQRIRGVKKNEDVFSIQIMDMRERIQGYLKSSLQDVIYEKISLMPPFGQGRMNDGDLNDLIGYLTTLRGAEQSVR
jgi:mono/diheme cytochrome c family protein